MLGSYLGIWFHTNTHHLYPLTRPACEECDLLVPATALAVGRDEQLSPLRSHPECTPAAAGAQAHRPWFAALIMFVLQRLHLHVLLGQGWGGR